MSSIGDLLYDLFGTNELGLLLAVFFIFLIDAIIFPALPELFFVGAYMYDPNLLFGIELLCIALVAEVLGVAILYSIVSRIRIPKRIDRIVNKYIDFLVLGDERLILLNRIAPMIPFCGAFIRIAGWDIKKSLLFVGIGCIAKYGLIMLMSDFFFGYFSSDDAQLYTLLFIFVVIGVSFLLSMFYKKKNAIE